MTYQNFGAICDAILADDQAFLEALPLEPNGVYQTVSTTLHDINRRVVDTLARAFEDRPLETFPQLAVSCGKCRVGSTALTNLFGIAGHPSYYQPVKTILRFEALGERGAPWNVPEASANSLVHCKEMTGPYSLAECIFDPIDLLLAAGYPAERMTMIALDRAPIDSLDSWLEKWSKKVEPDRLLQHYVISALNAERTKARAEARGVSTISYVYEASKMPHDAVAGLLNYFGMREHFTTDMVDDWGKRGSLESADSLVRFPVEPDPYVVVGLHASETRYKYKPRKTDNVTPSMKDLLQEYGIMKIYENSKKACFEGLNLSKIPT